MNADKYEIEIVEERPFVHLCGRCDAYKICKAVKEKANPYRSKCLSQYGKLEKGESAILRRVIK